MWALQVGEERALDPPLRHILLLLGSLADETGGRLFPSHAYVARRTGMAKSTVRRHMESLEAAGMMARSARERDDGSHTSNEYQLMMVQPGLGFEATPPMPTVSTGVPNSSRGHAHQRAGGVPKSSTHENKEDTKDVKGRSAKGAKRAPSAVSACFQAYQTTIKTLYGADYPTSAKANGQLANLVARVGAEQAVAVVKYFLARTDPWLIKRKHGLDYLCREGERWFLEMQAATGGGGTTTVTVARTALVYEGDEVAELKEYPAGDPEQIARKVLVDWRSKISNTKPKYISVLQGKKATRFSLSELMERRA